MAQELDLLLPELCKQIFTTVIKYVEQKSPDDPPHQFYIGINACVLSALGMTDALCEMLGQPDAAIKVFDMAVEIARNRKKLADEDNDGQTT
jgi:hypothetical protein